MPFQNFIAFYNFKAIRTILQRVPVEAKSRMSGLPSLRSFTALNDTNAELTSI